MRMAVLKLHDSRVTTERVKLAKLPDQAGKELVYAMTDCTGMAVPGLEDCQERVAETVHKGFPPAMRLSWLPDPLFGWAAGSERRR